MKATDKQVRYIMVLLHKAGYSTDWMNAKFKELGASMRERSGKVESWVAGLNCAQASELIETLRSRNESP